MVDHMVVALTEMEKVGEDTVWEKSRVPLRS